MLLIAPVGFFKSKVLVFRIIERIKTGDEMLGQNSAFLWRKFKRVSFAFFQIRRHCDPSTPDITIHKRYRKAKDTRSFKYGRKKTEKLT